MSPFLRCLFVKCLFICAWILAASLFTLCVSVSEPLAHLPGTAHPGCITQLVFFTVQRSSSHLRVSCLLQDWKGKKWFRAFGLSVATRTSLHAFMTCLFAYSMPCDDGDLVWLVYFIYVLTNACTKARGQCWIPSLITLHHVVLSQGLSQSLELIWLLILLSLPPQCWDLQLCQCRSVTWILGTQTQVLMLL